MFPFHTEPQVLSLDVDRVPGTYGYVRHPDMEPLSLAGQINAEKISVSKRHNDIHSGNQT